MKNYLDSFQGNILDPIHGVIKISEIEKWFLFQKPFNRLKRIKQNTFLYYVFPSANHTRFEHSIGVMHLASEIFESICKNYISYEQKTTKYNVEAPKDFHVINIKKILEAEDDQLEVRFHELRLAALLHDVGHGPMSHKFDDFTLKKEEFIKIIDSTPELTEYKEAFEHFLSREKIKNSTRVDHEVISCLFALKLIKELKEKSTIKPKMFTEHYRQIIERIDAKNVAKMIEPDFIFDDIKAGAYNFTDFFSSIISSFPIDVDRMDYLLRDSYFSGVNYGLYDLSRLFMSLLPIEKDSKVRIALKESGFESVIRFIQSRTHLYNQIYYHKTNRAANKLLDFCCRDLIEKKESLVDATTYEELEQFYWTNSDELFLWNTLERKIIDKESIEYKALEELKQRKLWKRIYEKVFFINEINEDTKSEIDNQTNKIKLKLKELEPNHYSRSCKF